jgi:hypothetical protein
MESKIVKLIEAETRLVGGGEKVTNGMEFQLGGIFFFLLTIVNNSMLYISKQLSKI